MIIEMAMWAACSLDNTDKLPDPSHWVENASVLTYKMEDWSVSIVRTFRESPPAIIIESNPNTQYRYDVILERVTESQLAAEFFQATSYSILNQCGEAVFETPHGIQVLHSDTSN
jgi:hypothetical protein